MPKYKVKSPVKDQDGIHGEGETIAMDRKDADELVELGALEEIQEASLDPAEREAAIKTAIAALDLENPENVISDGRPNTGVLSAAVGFAVSAVERDAAWQAIKQETSV
jgi:hypothetical protein